ncbi:aminoglycoside phosphotransferase [Mycobacterium sp. IS-1742]|uniref:phosphotransferase n=1 Tax=Mycobacterium sp. IS-1742 TaxID=1772285 RepID=UPI00074003DE|nr:phosphotransferase [Mycobacterium sp. IS-1742]KUI33228.1 aminoglycoside phosphotransferase [Mycobacterium sp. IS-1742]
MLSPDDLASRTARAVAAATAAGRDLGLHVDEPRVLYDVFSVIVHLAPAPVAVRVPTVLPPALRAHPDRQTAQQRAELAVAGWLADRGLPVVPPSPLVPREPVVRDGFSMTFWRYLDAVTDAEPDWRRRCASTARLHAALRDHDGAELGFFTQFGTYIPEALAELEHHPDLLDRADLVRAHQDWERIGPVLTSRATFESEFPGVDVQPIHGDAPFHNMIVTAAGEYWSDFELVTLGAVESDLALVGPEGREAYDAAAADLGLRTLDERVVAITESAGLLAAVACLAMAPQLPMLVDALAPTVDLWRATSAT